MAGLEETGMMVSKECHLTNKHELWNGDFLRPRNSVHQVDSNRIHNFHHHLNQFERVFDTCKGSAGFIVMMLNLGKTCIVDCQCLASKALKILRSSPMAKLLGDCCKHCFFHRQNVVVGSQGLC